MLVYVRLVPMTLGPLYTTEHNQTNQTSWNIWKKKSKIQKITKGILSLHKPVISCQKGAEYFLNAGNWKWLVNPIPGGVENIS